MKMTNHHKLHPLHIILMTFGKTEALDTVIGMMSQKHQYFYMAIDMRTPDYLTTGRII